MNTRPKRIYRLAPPSDPKGVSCDKRGARVGPVALLQGREDGKWESRQIPTINAELTAFYGFPIDVAGKVGGIAAVSNALNENNLVRAIFATLHLRFPDLLAESGTEKDALDLADSLYESNLLSKEWDPSKHPRWPAGQSDGGQFRSENGSPTQTAAADRWAICNQRCARLLERRKLYKWSDINTYAYHLCMAECLREPG